MSLFPACEIDVVFDDERLVPGRLNRGRLVVRVPEPIPRAERITLVLRGESWAEFGSGKSRERREHVFHEERAEIAVPEGGLVAGVHTFAFAFDVPENHGQSYVGDACGTSTFLQVRVDVDWAIDPTTKLEIVPRHRPGPRTAAVPVATRSLGSFDETVCVELTLDSSVVARGKYLTGSLALRSGHTADFRRLSLVLVHQATTRFHDTTVRPDTAHRVDLDVAELRRGGTVAFRLPTASLPFDQNTGVLDLASYLQVELDPGLLSFTKRWPIPLTVLPVDTPVEGVTPATAVGASRLRDLAATLASELGLRAGALPTLVEGRSGAVSFAVEDATFGAQVGARVTLDFPSLRLGLASRAVGLLVRPTDETPEGLRGRWSIRSTPASPHVTPHTTRALVSTICDGILRADELDLGDEHVRCRLGLRSDDPQEWRIVVTETQARARALDAAIAALPMGTPGVSEPAWRSTAHEEGATLLPHLPELHGVTRSVRVLGGESRAFVASILTRFDDGAPRSRLEVRTVDVDLLPGGVLVGDGGEALRALRALLPDVDAVSARVLVASRPGVTFDPRELLPAFDAVIALSLEARRERVVVAPYR